MFDADRPIENSGEDRLNRTLFSKYLARCLLDHPDPESLVVGLYGGFGVGKTSILNLVREELNFAASNMLDEEKPIILNFSVWSYSGQNQLIYSYFRRLSSALRSNEFFVNDERIIHLLELYASFFTHQPVPKPYRPKRTLLEKLTFKGREEAYGWESGRDLTEIKAELNELLKQQKHKIIIMIDNISRLYPEEIKQVFQIVKSMANNANMLYILAFDKDQVIDAMNEVENGGGKEFIEKIIQLPFAVPPIQQQDLENIFADRLNEIMPTVPEDSWNVEYWADIYYSSLKYFFKDCRDITHYVNTLHFSYSRVRDVINPIDFFALTAIEVFLPEVYAGIRDNKDLFTDLLDNVYPLDKEHIQKDKMRCDEILARTDDFPRSQLLALLIRLFPRLRALYEPDLPFFHSDALARKLKRICSPDAFDIYFRLSLQKAHIQSSEFKTLLSLASNQQAFDEALTRLNQDDRILSFIDQLDGKSLHQVPREHVSNVINALIDNGDLFPQGTRGYLSLDTPMRIHRIIHVLLHRFSNKEDRFAILQNAIADATKSIYISVHELKEQRDEHMQEEDTLLPLEYRDLLPEQLDLLSQLVVSRIENWADTDRLVDHPQLLPILYAWRDWGNEEKCKQFVKRMTDTDRGLVTFLEKALNKAILEAATRYEKSISWHEELKNIEAFISPAELVPHAKTLFEDNYFEKLREHEQLALMIFLDLMNVQTTKVIPKTVE